VTEYDVRVAGFAELDALTAYRLWQLRESVFVVEQECAYQELDGRDVEPGTRHLWIEADAPADGPVGYLRLLDEGDHARIGRVLVAPSHRGRGVSGALMRAALDVIGDRASVLSAQTPLADWYATFGYVPDGDPFVEDGIPHTPMRRDPPRR
jgi:predicted GNAT family N-acyltransferase